MSRYDEYLARRRQDPEYREVERRLKFRLDAADLLFTLWMKWRAVKKFVRGVLQSMIGPPIDDVEF